jgi:hypothetical protein
MSGYYAYFTGDDGHITNRVTILAAKKPNDSPSNWLMATPWSYGRKAGKSRSSVPRAMRPSLIIVGCAR